MAAEKQPSQDYSPNLKAFGYDSKEAVMSERDSIDAWLKKAEISHPELRKHNDAYKLSLTWLQWIRYCIRRYSPSDPHQRLLNDIVTAAENVNSMVCEQRRMLAEIRKEEDIYLRLRTDLESCVETIDAFETQIDLLSGLKPLISLIPEKINRGFGSDDAWKGYVEQVYSDKRWVWSSYLKEQALNGLMSPAQWLKGLVDRYNSERKNAVKKLEMLRQKRVKLSSQTELILPAINTFRRGQFSHAIKLAEARDTYGRLMESCEFFRSAASAKKLLDESAERCKAVLSDCEHAQITMETIDGLVEGMHESIHDDEDAAVIAVHLLDTKE